MSVTYEEKLLTRCLLLSSMHWSKVAYIVGSLPKQGAIKCLEYIAEYRELDQDDLYSTALEILEQFKGAKE